MKITPMKKLCYIATIPAVVHSFLRPHIQAAAEHYDVTIICNSTDQYLLDGLNAHIILLPITRKPSPWKDMLTLVQLFQLFRYKKFDIVHSIMPKTGMLAMLAAWLAHVPIRIHTFTGQVWVTKQGIKRLILQWFDKIISHFATTIFIDSPSQRDFLVHEEIVTSNKAKVLGAGSICGIDPLRFHPDLETKKSIRHKLGLSLEAKIILFVGRLNHDKGVLDLAASFNRIAKDHPNIILLLVGAQEDVPLSRIQDICHNVLNRVHYVSFTSTPEHYMMAADIFCLPSYREGFGLTIIEAAACGIPTVASRIYGITDAIKDKETGLLFNAGDVTTLTQMLLKLLMDQDLCHQLGEAARIRALTLFDSQNITNGMLAIYNELLENHIHLNNPRIKD